MPSLIERIQNILLNPRQEWPVIAAEPDSISSLYTRYILIVSALPVLTGFVKMSLIGTGLPFTDATVRIGVGIGLATMAVQYGLALLGVFLVSLVIDALAPHFGGEKNPLQALKTVAYAYTASWVAGLAVLLPWIGWLLSLLGSGYSVYLLYLGLPQTMRAAPERAAGYTAVVVLVAFVLGVLIGAVGGVISGAAGFGAMSQGSDVEISTRNGKITIDEDAIGQLDQMAKRMEAAGQKMEEAQKSGDTVAQQAALGEAMGAMFGGAQGKVEALSPEQLKPFVPEQLGGLDRKTYEVERNTAMGIQVASGKASYRDGTGEQRLDLEITDMGGMSGLTLLAGWALAQTERESDLGYERVYEQDGMRVHEQWDAERQTGEYGLIVADRFLIKLEGRGMEMDALKAAAATLDLPGLAALKDQGREGD